jgi:hypothetical protein
MNTCPSWGWGQKVGYLYHEMKCNKKIKVKNLADKICG